MCIDHTCSENVPTAITAGSKVFVVALCTKQLLLFGGKGLVHKGALAV